MARRISRTGYDPIDMSTLVATDFIAWEVLYFYMKATFLHDLVKSNPKAMYAYEIIQKLNTKFRSLKAQGLWIPSEGKN